MQVTSKCGGKAIYLTCILKSSSYFKILLLSITSKCHLSLQQFTLKVLLEALFLTMECFKWQYFSSKWRAEPAASWWNPSEQLDSLQKCLLKCKHSARGIAPDLATWAIKLIDELDAWQICLQALSQDWSEQLLRWDQLDLELQLFLCYKYVLSVV